MRLARIVTSLAAIVVLVPLCSFQCGGGGRQVNLAVSLGKTPLDSVQRRLEGLPGFETTVTEQDQAGFKVEGTLILFDLKAPGDEITNVLLYEQEPEKTTVKLGVLGLFIGDQKVKFDRNLMSKGVPGMYAMMSTTDYPGDVDGTIVQVGWKEGQMAVMIHYGFGKAGAGNSTDSESD